MRIFLITDIKIVNDEWFPAYAENAHEIVHTHGGRYLSRSGNITTVEGEGLDISLFAFIEFPSMQHSESFAHNPEYAPYATARQVGSISRFHISDSSDLAGTIPYLVASLNMNSKKLLVLCCHSIMKLRTSILFSDRENYFFMDT